MPLSPEFNSWTPQKYAIWNPNGQFRQYGRIEGIPLDTLGQEITRLPKKDLSTRVKKTVSAVREVPIFNRSKRQEVGVSKKTSVENFIDSVNAVSSKSVASFFRTVDYFHTHAPKGIRVPLFSWEKDYFKHNPDKGNSKDRQTWIDLRDEDGINSRKMLVLKLQRELVIPDEMLSRMIRQAKRQHKTRLEAFRQWTQKELNDLIDHMGFAAVLQGVAKGLISVVPQHPGANGLYFLGGGMIGDELSLKERVSVGNAPNFFARVGDIFAGHLYRHYVSHESELTKHKEFSINNTQQIAKRIFEGAHFGLDSSTLRKDATGIAIGVGIAQLIQDASSGSLINALISLIGPAATSLYLYLKLHKTVSGPDFEKYVEDQAKLHDKVDSLHSSVARRIDTKPSEEIEILELVDELVKDARGNNRQVWGVLQRVPSWAAFLTESLELTHNFQSNPGAQSLVTGGLIAAALSGFGAERTRKRNMIARNYELKRVARMLDAIDAARTKSPDDDTEDVTYDESNLLSREEAHPLMQGPMIIEKIVPLQYDFPISVQHMITLPPGVSIVTGEVGAGKSTLLKHISFNDGDLSEMIIRKGSVGFNELKERALEDEVKLIEERENRDDTLAQRMFLAIRTPNSLFHEAILSVPNNELRSKYGDAAIDQFYTYIVNGSERLQYWLDSWADDPLATNIHNNPELEIACKTFTYAFHYLVSEWGHFLKVKKSDDSANFLQRKVGPGQGTSAGQTFMLRFLEAIQSRPSVLLIDDPTASLAGDSYGPINDTAGSVDAFIKVLNKYMEEKNPNAVIIVSTNNNVFKNRFEKISGKTLKQHIFLAEESTEKNFVWTDKVMYEEEDRE